MREPPPPTTALEEAEPDPVTLPLEDSLDLHLFAPREASDLVTEYLHAAQAHGFGEVRLIHGKGKGILRTRVEAVLRHHPAVDSYALAGAGRGGWGATVVRLRPAPLAPPGAPSSPAEEDRTMGHEQGESYQEQIRRRTSQRTYDGRALSPQARQDVQAVLQRLPATGPFGGQVRLRLLEAEDASRLAGETLGTYGFIRDAPAFLAGAIRRGAQAEEDFGYLFEILLLEMTRLGLGTCWLGGTFRRELFARRIDLQPEEIVPAVSPLGVPRARRGLVDRTVRFFAGAARRKPWESLFFLDRYGQPLPPAPAGAYAAPLEAVRLAPSASNNQPWRLVLEGGPPVRVHFFLERTPGYRRLTEVDLQRIDLGIALAHFELVARELGLAGGWQPLPEARAVHPTADPTDYLLSWCEA